MTKERTMKKRDLHRLYYKYSKLARLYGLDTGACGLSKSHRRLYVEMYVNDPPESFYLDEPSEYACYRACQ